MAAPEPTNPTASPWNRRTVLGALLSTSALAAARAQTANDTVSPEATPRDWSGQNPLSYPEPDVVALDPRFDQYVVWNAPIQRLYTGSLWAEGPAWNGVGRYLVWSDIPNNMQLRWIAEDARVTTFRSPSGNSNGNTFDYQGRQLSCEHGGRRVARYESDGSVTTVADRFEGRRLNSPNDVVVHPDGSIWFTDLHHGNRGEYEGSRGESETKEAVYRVAPDSGQVTMVTDDVHKPNGLCFSPDYMKLYVTETDIPTTRDIKVWDVAGTALRNGRLFTQVNMPGTGDLSWADGIRCDRDGNIWAGALPGVQVFAPDGDRIGMIRLPEICGNICFGGPKRNRLFMTASQSLYSVYVGTQGAHIA
jgi:gluconolactonase